MILRGTKVKARTYWEIEEITRKLRQECQVDDMELFPIVRMVEAVAREGFQVVSNDEIGNNDGLTYPDQGIILIREDVYYAACDGNERARDTMAHELGHLVLHGSTSMARSNVTSVVGPLMDSEWQADEFSGLLLAPTHLIAGKTAAEVSKMCGIPLQTAINRVKKAKLGLLTVKNLAKNTSEGLAPDHF
jgi:Zn-dependent peptidase ImmA (M78 family)